MGSPPPPIASNACGPAGLVSIAPQPPPGAVCDPDRCAVGHTPPLLLLNSSTPRLLYSSTPPLLCSSSTPRLLLYAVPSKLAPPSFKFPCVCALMSESALPWHAESSVEEAGRWAHAPWPTATWPSQVPTELGECLGGCKRLREALQAWRCEQPWRCRGVATTDSAKALDGARRRTNSARCHTNGTRRDTNGAGRRRTC